jgi:transposase
MLSPEANTRIFLALDAVDMRRGFDGLAAQVAEVLRLDPFSGALFLFRGKRGGLLKAIYWDGQGLCLFAKRLEKGGFVWPVTRGGVVRLSKAQLSMLLEGMDWRRAVLEPEPAQPTAV